MHRLLALLRRRNHREDREIVAREQQRGIGEPPYPVEREIWSDIGTELGGVGPVVVGVVVALPAGRQQVERGHRRAGGAEMRDVESVVERPLAPTQAAILIEGCERACLGRGGDPGRPLSLLGDDGNHATDRLRAVEAALRATQHLDARDIGGQELPEVERTRWIAGIAGVDAVDQDLDVVRVGPAHEDRREAARSAGLHDVEAGNRAQGIRDGATLLALDLGGRYHRHRAGDIPLRGHDAGRADHDRSRWRRGVRDGGRCGDGGRRGRAPAVVDGRPRRRRAGRGAGGETVTSGKLRSGKRSAARAPAAPRAEQHRRCDDAECGPRQAAAGGASRDGNDGHDTRPRARRRWHVTANEVSPDARACTGAATVGTPRPTCSRVTTADGRSPGSRVAILRRLPGTREPSGMMTEDSPLTVAGAAAESATLASPRSLLIPEGNRRDQR